MTTRSATVRSVLAVGLGITLAGCQSQSAKPPAPIAKANAPTAPPVVADKTPPPVSAPEPKVVVLPAAAELSPYDPGLQFLVQVHNPTGGAVDHTPDAQFHLDPPDLATIEAGGYLRPLKPGKVRVTATTSEGEAHAEVTISDSPGGRAWDFDSDIVPLLTKLNCNSGGCHGKADGQNGFHLSLFGYDPAGDYDAITRSANARRISTADPELSLLIQKATGIMPHGGQRRIVPGSIEESLIVDWIAAGAPRSTTEKPDPVVQISVEPGNIQLVGPGPLQLRVLARHQSGRETDVTRLANYKSNNDSVATVDPATGLVKLDRRAETDIVVRFMSRVVPVRVATLINPDLKFDFAALPRRNVIDQELFKRLEALRVPPSPPAPDAAFLRRASLDLTGQAPETAEIREFLADTDPEKRAKKIDELIGRKEFMRFWMIKFGDLLQISRARFPNTAGSYQYWLEQRLLQNAHWDQMVKELLTSLGDPTVLKEGGPVNYALDGETPQVMGELAAQRFLGLRLRCAQCHDHPFDIWTQDDYYGFSAFFAKIDRGGAGGADAMYRRRIKVNPDGKVEHLRTKQPADPRLLGGQKIEVPKEDDPRGKLAEWMTQPENPYFARAFVNWAWAQFFGKGIVDPPDDLSAANPAVHPELLDALAKHFVEHQYDIRDLVRMIATSEAYGLSSKPLPENLDDTRLFSHQIPRPLTAHQMADALAQATDVPNVFPERQSYAKKERPRAIDVFDPGERSPILDTFGRCARTVGCSSTGTPQLSLRQALLVIGGGVLDDKVSHLNGYLSNLLELQLDPSEVVENLYMRALCRPPSADESAYWTAEIKSSPNRRETAEDLFWALLNSREFAFNH
jgi:hypothetical protein